MSCNTLLISRHRTRFLIALGLLLTLAGGGLLLRPAASQPAELLVLAQDAFSRKDYATAEQFAARVPATAPQSQAAKLIAGDAAAQSKQFERALDYYERVADDGSPQAVSALVSAGLVHRELGHAAAAERAWRRALDHEPGNLSAHNSLAHLLAVEGRSWEAIPHFLEPVRRSRFRLEHLLLLGSVAPIVKDPALIERCLHALPDDPIPLLGRARQLQLTAEQPVAARAILDRITTAAPDLAEAQARLGQQFVDANETDAFYRWHNALPTTVDVHPEVWVVRGTWARNHDDLRTAARCFAEAVRRDPDHQAANHQAGQTLVALGESDRARPFLERAALLSELTNTTGLMQNDHRPSPDQVRRAAHLAERLGRLWEAWGWSRLALAELPTLDWPAQLQARIAPRLSDALGRTLPEVNPVLPLDITAYPLPAWSGQTGHSGQFEVAAAPALSFIDRAHDAGLHFQYFNGGPEELVTGRMQETTGGGAAACDYDRDGWTDLYFTQGCQWPPQAGQSEHVDRLFRNLADGRCRDVTSPAGLGDPAFSQGVAVGDYNSDGFPDLVVANIGRNTFFVNNGDGTFTDMTDTTATAGNDWTTSCALADLDGDSHCDLYVVNYLQGDDVFSRVCRHSSGIVAGCGPEHFAAAQDRVYRNLGDGRFEDVTATCGVSQPDGKGLGIVVADFAGHGRPDVYVANDGTANFHFANRTSSPGGPLRFAEHALASGLAFDWQGRPQAGMGIAAGDVDGDARLDLFVTNYLQESNTLYRQHSPESFDDQTRNAALTAPSLAVLGFGTQFLDADLNGAPDLVVANGHVHNLAAADIPYEMPPHFFLNRGGGRFDQQQPHGNYFSVKHRGRGLARLDWNRDLLDDFAVSQLGSPAALVINETPSTAHALAIRLCGVASNRDAIGAVASVRIGDRSLTAQLTAGDGYQASNERQLTFGLGDAGSVDELTIHWPGHASQTIHNLPADRRLLIVEGRDPLVDAGK